MLVRTFARSQAEPLPLPRYLSSLASPAIKGVIEADAAFDPETECPPDEFPTAAGCLRGFCSAMAIEASAGLVVFVLWHFRHLLG